MEKDKRHGVFVKTSTVEKVDKNGEIVSVENKTEVIKEGKNLSFMLLNMSSGMKFIPQLDGIKLHIFLILAYQSNKYDNTVNISLPLIDEIARILSTKEKVVARRRIQSTIKQMERDMTIAKIYSCKYILSPDIVLFGGSKNYEHNMAMFQDAIRQRTSRFMFDSANSPEFGQEWEDRVKKIKDGKKTS
jgi:hypothetical protein